MNFSCRESLQFNGTDFASADEIRLPYPSRPLSHGPYKVQVFRCPHSGGPPSEQIIKLRNGLVPAQGAVRVAGDGLDIARWADALDGTRAERVVITLEGVLAYQSAESVAGFFADAVKAFPGAYVLFDRLSPSAVARANHPGMRAGGVPNTCGRYVAGAEAAAMIGYGSCGPRGSWTFRERCAVNFPSVIA